MTLEIPFAKIKKIRIVNERLMAEQIKKKYNPDWFINGVLYDTITGATITRLKDNGLAYGYMFSDEGIGVKDNQLVWCRYDDPNILDFAAGGPVLRRDNMVDIHWGNAYSRYIDLVHMRSAIGFDRSKIILYVSDNVETLTELANKIKTQYLINLDGGGSSHLQEGNNILRKSNRANASWILIWGDNLKTNENLVIHCMTALSEKWGYVFGTWGQVLTETILNQKRSQYPNIINQDRYNYIQNNYLGKRTADCGGLIKSFLWWTSSGPSYKPVNDVSVDTMLEQAKEKGTINTQPELPGLVVWYKGHAGVYIGNKEVIEARGTMYGVVQTKISERPWTHWFKHKDIEYLEKKEDQLYTDVTNDRWSYHDIKAVTEAGIMGGFPDGSFRPTENVTREQIAAIVNRILKRS
jgi:hypothetical protein